MAFPPATQDEASAILLAELTTPTFGFPYVDGTTEDDADSASSLNTRDQVIGKQALTSVELAREVTLADYIAAEADEKTWYDALLSAGAVTPLPITNGSEVANGLVAMFPGGSDTRNNLLAVSEPGTRFDKLMDDNSFAGVLVNGTVRPTNSLTGAQVRKGWDYTP